MTKSGRQVFESNPFCEAVLWESVRTEVGICSRSIPPRGQGLGDVLAQNYNKHSLNNHSKLELKILSLFKLINVLLFQSRYCKTVDLSH